MRIKSLVIIAVLTTAILCSVPATASAALTSAQISSIIDLLRAFGADSATIANVQASLTGGTSISTLSLVKNASYGNQTTTAPLASHKLAQYTLTNNTGQAINLNTINIGANISPLNSYVSNLYVKYGLNQTTLITSVNNVNSWSVNYTLPAGQGIDVFVYGDVSSQIPNGTALQVNSTIIGVGATPASSFSTGNVAGQSIIFGPGTIVSAVDGSTPSNQTVTGNQEVMAARFKFTTTGGDYTITELKVAPVYTASAAIITSAILKDGNTTLSTVPYNAVTGNFYFTGLNISVPANTFKVLTVNLSLGAPTTSTPVNAKLSLTFFRALDKTGTAITDNSVRIANDVFISNSAQPTSINISDSKGNVNPIVNRGETRQLFALDQNNNIISNSSLTWTSYSPQVASVSSTGLVSALASGQTNITASLSGLQSNAVSVTVPIVNESITLTSPNGGENWKVGETHNITWNSTGVNSVSIEAVSSNGTVTVATNIPSSNNYSWVIPSYAPVGSYKVFIGNVLDGLINDSSDNYFTISAAQEDVPVISSFTADTTNAVVGSTVHFTWLVSNYTSCRFNKPGMEVGFNPTDPKTDSYTFTSAGAITFKLVCFKGSLSTEQSVTVTATAAGASTLSLGTIAGKDTAADNAITCFSIAAKNTGTLDATSIKSRWLLDGSSALDAHFGTYDYLMRNSGWIWATNYCPKLTAGNHTIGFELNYDKPEKVTATPKSVTVTTTSSAMNGQCNTPNMSQAVLAAADFCRAGLYGNQTISGNNVNWDCVGTGTGATTAHCSAVRPATVVNGSCGTANGKSLSAAPTVAQRCVTGTPINFATITTGWTWNCQGSGGGATSPQCKATKVTAPAPVAGLCGTAQNTTVSVAPTVAQQCATGTPANFVAATASWTWSCTGLNNGATVPCHATKSVASISSVSVDKTTYNRGNQVRISWQSANIDQVLIIWTQVDATTGGGIKFGWVSHPEITAQSGHNIVNSGSYTWTIPGSATDIPDGQYIVQVFIYDPNGGGNGAGSIMKTSNAFTIRSATSAEANSQDVWASLFNAIINLFR